MNTPLSLRPQAGARSLTATLLPTLEVDKLAERFVCAVVDEQGREIPITEAMIQQALCAFDASCAGVASGDFAAPADAPATH